MGAGGFGRYQIIRRSGHQRRHLQDLCSSVEWHCVSCSSVWSPSVDLACWVAASTVRVPTGNRPLPNAPDEDHSRGQPTM